MRLRRGQLQRRLGEAGQPPRRDVLGLERRLQLLRAGVQVGLDLLGPRAARPARCAAPPRRAARSCTYSVTSSARCSSHCGRPSAPSTGTWMSDHQRSMKPPLTVSGTSYFCTGMVSGRPVSSALLERDLDARHAVGVERVGRRREGLEHGAADDLVELRPTDAR